MAFIQFDATEIPTESPREALPAGDYPVVITDSSMKTAKSGGEYLELVLQVIDGPYSNRLVWDRITLSNPSPKAVEIGKRTLSQICHAVGLLQVQDSAQLHSIPLMARLKYKDDPQWGPSNDVGGYRAMSQAPAAPSFAQVPSAAPFAAPPPRPVAPVAGGAPPWAAKAA
jgi:hypothetical protein